MWPAEKNWWKTLTFRQHIARKIHETILGSDAPYVENAVELENRMFQRAKNKDDYFCMVLHLIKRIRRKGAKQHLKSVFNCQDFSTSVEDMEDKLDSVDDEKLLTTTEELSDLKDLTYELWSTNDSQGMFAVPSCSYHTRNFIM